MADPSKVRSGDTLWVPIKVIYIEHHDYPNAPLIVRTEMPNGDEGSLSRTDVEAAHQGPSDISPIGRTHAEVVAEKLRTDPEYRKEWERLTAWRRSIGDE